MHLLLFLLFSNYHQKVNEMHYLKHFCVQKYGKFAYHNLENFCFWLLDLFATISALAY